MLKSVWDYTSQNNEPVSYDEAVRFVNTYVGSKEAQLFKSALHAQHVSKQKTYPTFSRYILLGIRWGGDYDFWREVCNKVELAERKLGLPN